MNEGNIIKRYTLAKEAYAALNVDVDSAVELIDRIPISMNSWQGDDLLGFEGATNLTGGIQTTGNYLGRARNADELRNDVMFALS